MNDRGVLERGNGGYSVHTRFGERWIDLPPPADDGGVPTASEAARFHPYLNRMLARGCKIRRVWTTLRVPGEPSIEGIRLGYAYESEMRDAGEEVVLISDPAQFTEWIDAMRRQEERR